MTAARHNALRRGRDNLLHFRCGVAALVLRDAYARLFARQGKGTKTALPSHVGQKGSAVNGLFNLDQLQRRRHQRARVGAFELSLETFARIVSLGAASLLAHIEQAEAWQAIVH